MCCVVFCGVQFSASVHIGPPTSLTAKLQAQPMRSKHRLILKPKPKRRCVKGLRLSIDSYQRLADSSMYLFVVMCVRLQLNCILCPVLCRRQGDVQLHEVCSRLIKESVAQAWSAIKDTRPVEKPKARKKAPGFDDLQAMMKPVADEDDD